MGIARAGLGSLGLLAECVLQTGFCRSSTYDEFLFSTPSCIIWPELCLRKTVSQLEAVIAAQWAPSRRYRQRPYVAVMRLLCLSRTGKASFATQQL